MLSESISDNKAINESPFIWWKKEIDPENEVIIMRNYNDVFYEYFLKNLGYDRFYYVRKSDFAVFPHNEAKKFYDEDIALYYEFIEQEKKDDGNRPMVIKEYSTKFKTLEGVTNKAGYWRYVREEEGHIYIYGRMKDPFIPK